MIVKYILHFLYYIKIIKYEQSNVWNYNFQIGISNIFTHEADLTNILADPAHLEVSGAVHKAYIDVNEDGCEAAAATGNFGDKMIRFSNFKNNLICFAAFAVSFKSAIWTLQQPLKFTADHPFLFFIMNDDNILFIGRKSQ